MDIIILVRTDISKFILSVRPVSNLSAVDSHYGSRPRRKYGWV